MRTFEAYTRTAPEALNSVVVIGNFDGVHRAHNALLEKAASIAKKIGAPLAVLTFEPHPRNLFRPDDPPFRITLPDLKAERLEEAGVDFLFSVKFDWDFASQSAEKFIDEVLINGLNPAHIVVGYDFHFGQLRKGTPETLKAAGLPVTVLDEVEEVSSTAIREALRNGKIDEANDLLGWQWEMRGIVAKGDQRGRDLGFPTANFDLPAIVHPAYGVYAAQVQIEGESQWRPAAVNIGIRPMFEIHTARVESYILNFKGDLYGQLLKVRPIKFLRGEAKFANVDELIAQMKKDCEEALNILNP